MVEIARAVHHNAQVIIFDEPTSTLTPEEKKYFFDLVDRLKARGVSIIFISHALEEALQISDRITVMRDGKHVVTDVTAAFDREKIVRAMVGRALSQTLYGPRKTTVRPQGKRVLSVQNLRCGDGAQHVVLGLRRADHRRVRPDRLGPHRDGQGRRRRPQARLLPRRPGAAARPPGALSRARPAVRDGIVYVTEDRKIEGFFETMSIADNIYLGLLAKLRGQRTLVSKKRGRRGREALDQAPERSRRSART